MRLELALGLPPYLCSLALALAPLQSSRARLRYAKFAGWALVADTMRVSKHAAVLWGLCTCYCWLYLGSAGDGIYLGTYVPIYRSSINVGSGTSEKLICRSGVLWWAKKLAYYVISKGTHSQSFFLVELGPHHGILPAPYPMWKAGDGVSSWPVHSHPRIYKSASQPSLSFLLSSFSLHADNTP